MGKKKTATTETETGSTIENAAEKLTNAGKLAEDQKAARRERVVKGAHLLSALRERAEKAGLAIEEKSSFLKITGPTKGKAVYVARKGGRVDLSGFTVDSDGINQISEEDARTKHLGKVRGQVNFDATDDVVLAAYEAALTAVAQAPESK